jgi:hypothetical protein
MVLLVLLVTLNVKHVILLPQIVENVLMDISLKLMEKHAQLVYPLV